MLSIKETFLIQIRRTDTLEIINDNDSNKSKLVKVGCMWVYRRDMHGGGGKVKQKSKQKEGKGRNEKVIENRDKEKWDQKSSGQESAQRKWTG